MDTARARPSSAPAPATLDQLPSPAVACDVILDAAISADADTLWIEPRGATDDRYTVTVERQGRVIATSMLDAGLGAVARTAAIAAIVGAVTHGAAYLMRSPLPAPTWTETDARPPGA